MYKATIATISIGLVLGTAVPASATLTSWILPQPDSPVVLTDCLAGARGEAAFYLDLGARFQNRSQRAISAVRLRFDVIDPFNAIAKTVRGTDDSPLEPGSARDDVVHNIEFEQLVTKYASATGDSAIAYLPTWEFVNAKEGRKYVCSVDRVAFADGKQWQAKPMTPALIKAAFATSPRTYPGSFYKSST